LAQHGTTTTHSQYIAGVHAKEIESIIYTVYSITLYKSKLRKSDYVKALHKEFTANLSKYETFFAIKAPVVGPLEVPEGEEAPAPVVVQAPTVSPLPPLIRAPVETPVQDVATAEKPVIDPVVVPMIALLVAPTVSLVILFPEAIYCFEKYGQNIANMAGNKFKAILYCVYNKSMPGFNPRNRTT
jgi:hypothetical protein